MAFLFTTRGIPQIYYADELLMEGPKPDGVLRKDFPGGWAGDRRNLFSASNRNADEADVHDYVAKILKWRKNAEEVHRGELKHFKPKENVYIYFRTLGEKSTMVIINNSDKEFDQFNLDYYQEGLKDFQSGTDILSGKEVGDLKSISLLPNTAYIIELKK